MTNTSNDGPILEVKGLKTSFYTRAGAIRAVIVGVVDEISLVSTQ